MSTTISQDQFRRLAERVGRWRRPLLLTHRRPDGDALGCVDAMARILRRAGAEPLALLYEPVPDRYGFLLPDLPPPEADVAARADAFAPDGVLILDTCSFAQLDPMADWLRAGGGADLPKVVVDHHVTRDPVADDGLVDESASAAALILFDWATAARWPIDGDIAQALFVGLATDTGWFRYSNTDARTLAAATRLVERGAQPHTLYDILYNQEPVERIRLQAAAMTSLELFCEGRVAVMTLSAEAFQAARAKPAHTEDVVNVPMQLRGVVVSVLITDGGKGVVRVSLRSRAPGPGVPDLNVAHLAASIGGGGHARAAGAQVEGDLESVRRQVVVRLREIL